MSKNIQGAASQLVEAPPMYLTDKDDELALIRAATNGSFYFVKLLISRGRDVNATNARGETALHRAAKLHRNTRCARMLIDAKANIEARSFIFGDTPLAVACRFSNLEAVKLLITKHANVEGGYREPRVEPLFKRSRLNYGASTSRAEPQEADADIEIEHSENSTPLILAAKHGSFNIVNYLLIAGAKVNARDCRRRTALHYAAENNHVKCMKLLLDKRATVDAVDDKNDTPFILAAISGRENAMQLLKRYGADKNRKGQNSRTALAWASNYANLACVSYLVEIDADPGIVDEENKTPHSLAGEMLVEEEEMGDFGDKKRYEEIIPMLERHGISMMERHARSSDS